MKNKINEAFVVLYSKEKGEKPSAAAYKDKDMAIKFEKQLKKDGYITMMTQKRVSGVDESVNESNEPKFQVGDIVRYKKDKDNTKAKVLKVQPSNLENSYMIRFVGHMKSYLAAESDLVKESINEAADTEGKRFKLGTPAIYKAYGNEYRGEVVMNPKTQRVFVYGRWTTLGKGGMKGIQDYNRDIFIVPEDWKDVKSYNDESVNEASPYQRSTASYINKHNDEYKVAQRILKSVGGNEMDFYDELSKLEDKIGHPKYMKFISSALRGYGVDMFKDPQIKNPADAEEALYLLSK